MTRTENIKSNLETSKKNIEEAINIISKDRTFSIIYDVFTEYQKDFEKKIKSEHEFRNLIIESLSYAINKLYDINTNIDNKKHIFYLKSDPKSKVCVVSIIENTVFYVNVNLDNLSQMLNTPAHTCNHKEFLELYERLL